jgi:hypothetical protein
MYDEILEDDDVFFGAVDQDERWNIALCFHRLLHESDEETDSLWENESLS